MILFSKNAQSQAIIKGIIIDEFENKINNSQVKLFIKSKSTLISFLDTRNSNKFTLLVSNVLIMDTLILKINNSLFQEYSQIIKLEKNDTITEYYFILKKKVQNKDTAIVKAPSIWRRGDTTNYSVKSFNNGTEKKLKDILLNLPGFSFDKDGNLLFKGAPINKIFIEGEDLFSDKSQLLLNSFPAHVVDKIQAIENQSQDAFLKNFSTRNQTNLNIKLNKKGKAILFGDVDILIGSKKRYLLNNTIFSIINKSKFALINNINNIGELAKLELNFTKKNEYQVSGFSHYAINNIPTINYISNNRKDVQLQINRPLNNFTKLFSTFSINSDFINQNYYQENNYLNNGIFNKRVEDYIINNKPLILQFTNKIVFAKNNLKELTLNHSLSFDKSNSNSNINIYEQNYFTVFSSIKSNNWSNSIYLVAKNILSEKLASKIIIAYNLWNNNYSGKSISDSYSSIFNSNNLLNILNIQQTSLNKNILVNWEIIRKNKNANNVFNINAFKKYINLETSSFLNELTNTQPKFSISSLSNNQTLIEERFLISKGEKLKIKKIDLLLESQLGISNISLFNNSFDKNNIKPYIKLASSFLKKFKENSNLKYILLYNNSNIEIDKINTKPLPLTLTNFNYYEYLQLLNNKYIENKIIYSFTNFEHFLFAVTNINIKTTFLSPLNINTIDRIFNISKIEYLKKTTSEINLSQNINFKINASRIDIAIGFNFNNFLIQNNLLLTSKASLKTFWYFLNYNINLNKKNYFALALQHHINELKLPNIFNLTENKNTNNYLITSLKNTYIKSEKQSISAFFSLNFYNINSLNFNYIKMLNLEYSYKAFKEKILFNIRFNNLLNQKNYYDYNNNPLSQTFLKIPIQYRNVNLGLKFNF